VLFADSVLRYAVSAGCLHVVYALLIMYVFMYIHIHHVVVCFISAVD